MVLREDAKLIAKGDMGIALGWALHLPAAVIVIFGLLTSSSVPISMVFHASYFAMAILEHRAHGKARARCCD